MRHYHVLCGLRGCFMPDTNDFCDSWAEAIQLAAVQAEAWSETHGMPAVRHAVDYYSIGQFSVEVYPCDSVTCEESHND